MSDKWDMPPIPEDKSLNEKWEWYNVLTEEGGASGATKGAAVLAGGATVIAAGSAIAAGVAMAPIVVPVAILAGIVGAITGGKNKRRHH